MSDAHDGWVDRLIEVEPPDAARRAKLQLEIRAVIERKLSPARRMALMAGGALLIVLGVGSGTAFLSDPRTEPTLVRICGTLATGACVLLGALMIWMAKRGVFNRRKHNQAFLALAALIMGTLSLVFLNGGWAANDPRMVFTGQLMLALLGIALILHFAEQYQLWARQKVLELEYRLADISEKLDRQDRPDGK